MCTASWIHEDAGYWLFFNRDEKLTRKKAMPPDFAARDGIRFLTPVDGDFGGTWIATNEFGVSICLLNGAGNQRHIRSRGLLIPEVISAPSVPVVCELVRAADFAVFAPFTLALLGPHQPAALVNWDGSRKTVGFQDEPCFMLTSSSFDSEAVRASRQAEFRGLVDAEFLARFHGSHIPARGAYSTCMHRPDAETVSFSRIHVSERDTDFFYSPAAPCEGILGVRLKLTRQVGSMTLEKF
ncbi:MAG TPA: NRDE family protein [Bryobacteraceae bacterium]|nr:NRDE family protein [Bryobacteraceae bacterium]